MTSHHKTNVRKDYAISVILPFFVFICYDKLTRCKVLHCVTKDASIKSHINEFAAAPAIAVKMSMYKLKQFMT